MQPNSSIVVDHLASSGARGTLVSTLPGGMSPGPPFPGVQERNNAVRRRWNAPRWFVGFRSEFDSRVPSDGTVP